MQTNYIKCCDNVAGLRELPDSCIDLTVTSPPYDNLRTYNGFTWDAEALISELYRVTKPGGVVVWVVGDATVNGGKTLTSYRQALLFNDKGFKLYDTIIYEKSGSSPPHAGRYFNAFEYMFVFAKGKPKTINLLKDKPNRWAGTTSFGTHTQREQDGSLTRKKKIVVNDYGVRTNIWRYANGRGFSTKFTEAHEHPAIFPEQLAKDHISSWSNPDDIVLDPFMGSGTTAAACLQLQRYFIGFDCSEEYCELARRRIAAAIDETLEEGSPCL